MGQAQHQKLGRSVQCPGSVTSNLDRRPVIRPMLSWVPIYSFRWEQTRCRKHLCPSKPTPPTMYRHRHLSEKAYRPSCHRVRSQPERCLEQPSKQQHRTRRRPAVRARSKLHFQLVGLGEVCARAAVQKARSLGDFLARPVGAPGRVGYSIVFRRERLGARSGLR